MTALLNELERRPHSTLPRRSVLVLDEAAMLPTRELAKVVDRVSRLEVKLVLVGDHRQLPSIGAGGAFQGLLAGLPTIELKQNRRQLHEWERDALALVRDGAAIEAVLRDAARSGSSSGRTPASCANDWRRTGGRRATPAGR